MNRWVYLSHFLAPDTPAYGGCPSLEVSPTKCMAQGDSCNTAQWSFPNHLGTHVDLPRHFVAAGQTLSDYGPEAWVFERIHLLDVSPATPGQTLGPSNLPVTAIPTGTELLLIKTGFEQHRGTPSYWQAGPVLRPELADALRQRCPGLRAIGFDTISLSSWTDRDTGREAHKTFLDHEQAILPVEDMALSAVGPETVFHRVVVCPLRVVNADGAPVTVLAEVGS